MKIKDGKKVKKRKDFSSEKFSEFTDDYEEHKKWYQDVIEDAKKFVAVTDQILIELKDEAKQCHDSEVANYHLKNSKGNSNYQWMKTVMSKGTISDKIAAHTVAIQDNPVCNLETLRNLINMVKVGKKKECLSVIETLTELFLSDLLRPDKKLKPFQNRPLSQLNELSSGNAITRRKLLSLWYFEDQLKEIYTSFVLALNAAAQDTVENNKEKAISAMYKLLCGNPEQEKNLLGYIVNKLGDPSQKVASKTIYCLTQLLFKHPNMQEVVLNEIEKLLFRSNISTRAQYYGLCFLSQFYLTHEASHVARKLIEVYFGFFKACVKKGDVDTRMMSALLMGINRAYPYAKLEFEKMAEHVDTIYRLVALASFNVSLQALALLYQASVDKMTDRFYAALYRKLFDPKLLTTTHQAMLLSLVYKALLRDTELNRVKVFIKRLLQVSLFVQPGFVCGILYLVSQLMGKRENLQALVLKQTMIDGLDENDDEETYHDVKEAKDESFEPVEIKIEVEDPEFKEATELKSNTVVIDNSTIEIKEEEEDVKPDVKLLRESLSFPNSWCHRKMMRQGQTHRNFKYNPLARNPLYGGGEFCSYIELSKLSKHFHPTVSMYANNILQGQIIKYSGDPLKDFTLIRFLDRFVFKNPKKFVQDKTGAHPTFGKRKLYKPKGVKLLPVNSASYIRENQKNIPVEELFMYKYLVEKYEHKSVKEEEDSDLESVQSEEFEEMLDKMTGVKDVDEEDIDYMNEIGENMKSKGKKKIKKTEDEPDEAQDSEDEAEFEESEDEDGHSEDDDLLEGLGDDEEEDIEFDDSGDEETFSKKAKKKLKSKTDDVRSLFASAEEFASLLEDEGSSKVKPGGSNAFANKDSAHQRQLDWEDKRNQWLHGFNKAVNNKAGKFGKSGKKRKAGGNFNRNNKKSRK